MEYLVGVLLALALGGFATAVGLERDRAFYPLMLIVIASYYVLFAIVGGAPGVALIEGLIMSVFTLAAIVGFKSDLWLVVGGLLSHGVLDLVHPHLLVNPGAPAWWPMFCLAFDVVAGGYLAVRLLATRSLVGGS